LEIYIVHNVKRGLISQIMQLIHVVYQQITEHVGTILLLQNYYPVLRKTNIRKYPAKL